MVPMLMPILLPVPVSPQDWRRGPERAPIALVEYGDFECEDSVIAHNVIKRLQEEGGFEICHIFREFPQADIHPHALDAAKGAEAAGRLGKFWEMHDALYEKRTLLLPRMQKQAQMLGLDAAEFMKAFADPQTYAAILEDVEGLRPSGVNASPTLFINGELYEGMITYRALSAFLAGAPGN